MIFFTEIEVAEMLRCSTSKVKRLRQSGALAYIPGRPVLVAEPDLTEYLERVKRNAKLPPPPEPMTPEEEHAAMVKSAREWALKIKHKIPRIKRTKTST